LRISESVRQWNLQHHWRPVQVRPGECAKTKCSLSIAEKKRLLRENTVYCERTRSIERVLCLFSLVLYCGQSRRASTCSTGQTCNANSLLYGTDLQCSTGQTCNANSLLYWTDLQCSTGQTCNANSLLYGTDLQCQQLARAKPSQDVAKTKPWVVGALLMCC